MTQQKNQTNIDAERVADDFDSPWKTAVEQYFPEFMAFYFPDAHAQIDWSKPHVFLDQELMALSRDAELGKRLLDKLVGITLLDDSEQWIYIHIEVQAELQKEFPKRMFVYNYRVFDRYDRPIASMAVLADEHPNWRPDHFGYSVLGCETAIRFPVAKLTDYHDQLDALLASGNAFALITAAHILTQRTRKNDQARKEAKSRLVRLLYQRQWDKERVLNLFYVLDWLLRLPDELEQQIRYEIQAIEEEEKMRYVSSVERLALAEGRQEGWQEGRQEGRQEGVLAGEAKIVKKQLQLRFGPLPSWVSDKLSAASEADLERWGEAVISAPTLDAVFDDSTTH